MSRSAGRASSRKLPQPSSRNWARAASLLLLLAVMPAVLLAAKHKKAAAAQNPATRPLTERERALQALNRLTFGPRPGDVDRVMAMGVDKWIDLQLDPQKIDDSALDAQLAGYPAIAMPLQDLIEKYPADSLVRAVADGKRPLPADPVERAIYNNQVADYEQKKEKKAEQTAQNGGTVQTPQPAMSMQAAPAMEQSAGPGMETENKPKRMAYTGPDAGEIFGSSARRALESAGGDESGGIPWFLPRDAAAGSPASDRRNDAAAEGSRLRAGQSHSARHRGIDTDKVADRYL